MFDVLLKYPSQYSKSIIFSCWTLSIHFFKIHISATFHHTVNRSGSDNFKIFSCDFTIVTGDGNTNYIVLFIVSRLSTKIQLSISGLLIVMGKPIRNVYLGIVKRDWTSIAYGKPFLFARGNIWSSRVVFYNKTTCLLRCECFNRDLWVVTPV